MVQYACAALHQYRYGGESKERNIGMELNKGRMGRHGVLMHKQCLSLVMHLFKKENFKHLLVPF